jgi:hypothetical protein
MIGLHTGTDIIGVVEAKHVTNKSVSNVVAPLGNDD